jgi:tetraacyldisaccharide 4'-kinase
MNEAPSFWWKTHSMAAFLLSPLSLIYGWIAGQRMGKKPLLTTKSPVLCVGNFITGGAGKTPTAITLAHAAKRAGQKPGFLSRGYGGGITLATLVDPDAHNSHDVGDEPLLLAAHFPIVVSPDRPKGADLLEQQDVNFIIMDDGFQNPSLHKDYNLVVVDSARGIGNGHAMPGGPLRASLGTQLAHANAVLVIGKENGADRAIRAAARRAKPVYEAQIVATDPKGWKNHKILAFAGIGDPEKFYSSLREAGANVVATRSFADHHPLSAEEATEIMQQAERDELEIVTTSKDAVRLKGRGTNQQTLLERTRIFDIRLEFDSSRIPAEIIEETIRRAHAFRL